MRRTLFALLTLLVGCGCVCGGCMCPSGDYQAAETADRQARAKPVIDALEAYKARHGRYPVELDELVREKLLVAVPDLAVNEDHRGNAGYVTNAGPLAYSPDGDGYRLWFEFEFVHTTGLASKTRRLEYRSESRRWSHTSPGGERPQTLPPTWK